MKICYQFYRWCWIIVGFLQFAVFQKMFEWYRTISNHRHHGLEWHLSKDYKSCYRSCFSLFHFVNNSTIYNSENNWKQWVFRSKYLYLFSCDCLQPIKTTKCVGFFWRVNANVKVYVVNIAEKIHYLFEHLID